MHEDECMRDPSKGGGGGGGAAVRRETQFAIVVYGTDNLLTVMSI